MEGLAINQMAKDNSTNIGGLSTTNESTFRLILQRGGGGSSKSEFADSKDLPDLKAASFYILRKSNGTKRNSLKFYSNYTKSTPCFLHDRREKRVIVTKDSLNFERNKKYAI